MPAAQIHTTNNAMSLLIGTRTYNISDATNRAAMQKTRKEISHNILNQPVVQENYTKADQQSVVVSYDPQVFPLKRDIIQTMHTDQFADDGLTAGKWRHKTKHRDITSTVTCFGNGFGEKYDTPFKITLTTGCAPNFMKNTSADLVDYVKEGQLIHPDKYKNTMKLLFKRWLTSQDNAGSQLVIMPLVGGGVYLNLLNDANKAEALTQINLALKETLSELHFSNIKEVAFALPDHDGLSSSYTKAVTIHGAEATYGTTLSIANIDVFDAAKIASDKGYKVGLINPGSDRTLGGYYKKDIDLSDTKARVTLEEMIFNLTNAADVQAKDFNKNRFEMKTYPPSLCRNSPSSKILRRDSDEKLNNAGFFFNSYEYRATHEPTSTKKGFTY